MVDEQAFADGGSRMDLHAGEHFGCLADETGSILMPVLMQSVSGPIGHGSVQTGVEREHFRIGLCCRIPLPHGLDVVLQPCIARMQAVLFLLEFFFYLLFAGQSEYLLPLFGSDLDAYTHELSRLPKGSPLSAGWPATERTK